MILSFKLLKVFEINRQHELSNGKYYYGVIEKLKNKYITR